MLKLAHAHFLAPLNRTINLFLWISFDWLGNPGKLLKGILAGFRELFMQPWRLGLRGIPRGIEVCLCSVFGSILDSLARIINSLFKGIDRVLRMIYTRVGVKTARSGTLILSLSRTPMGKRDGFKRGALLALLQCRTVFLNMRQIIECFATIGRHEYRWTCVYFFALAITLVLTLCLGIIEAVLLFLENVLKGFVVSLYRRSAESVCDWDPEQLVALEMPQSMRPQYPDAKEFNRMFERQGNVVEQYPYLPALVQAQMDPDEGLVPPWQWQRWSSGEKGQHDLVLSAIWCGKETRKKGPKVEIIFETESYIALLKASYWQPTQEIKVQSNRSTGSQQKTASRSTGSRHKYWQPTETSTTSGRLPKKPRATFETVWQVSKSDIEYMSMKGMKNQEDGSYVLSFHANARQQSVTFSSAREGFRAYELFSCAL
jgi:hypothetical protein